MQLRKDKLFILETRFADPAYAGDEFYCEHCIIIEGLLAAFPELAAAVDVERVSWPRPRASVVALVGEDNQNLPMLALAHDAPNDLPCQTAGEVRFENDKDKLLKLLALRHGIPLPHP